MIDDAAASQWLNKVGGAWRKVSFSGGFRVIVSARGVSRQALADDEGGISEALVEATRELEQALR